MFLSNTNNTAPADIKLERSGW